MTKLKSLTLKSKKIFAKPHSYLVWCIITLFVVLSFAFKGICDNGVHKSTITLPTAQDGIEKIEYMINGTARGSTDGVDKIEVESGSVISFAIKFQGTGYDKLHVRDIKIQSERGYVLRLNTYSKDDDGNFTLMRVADSETIDPNQTYVSSGYVVHSDDKFNITGISENTYSAIIRDEDNDVSLAEAVDLKYCENGGAYIDAPFSEKDNAFIIENIKNSSNVKLMINVREGYTDSNLSLVYGNNQLAISSESKICSLPEINDDFDLSIRGLRKKQYTVAFTEYTNAKFSCKLAGESDFSASPQARSVYHGETVEFTCDAQSEDILQNNEITADGIALSPENGVYKIENIKSDHTIAITPKNTSLYPIYLQNGEKRIKLCDLAQNEVPSINVNKDGSAEFKIIPSGAYSRYFIATEIYAVPTSKTSNGTYDLTANPEEANSFLVIPNAENVYSVQNVSEPMILIAKNMQASTNIVTIPDKIIGAKASVVTNDEVQQISDTKFSVNYGADFTVNIEAEPGYDISDMIIGDMDNSTHVVKNGNSYTYKNIDGDKYLIINRASEAYCNVSFNSKNLVLSDIYGYEWQENSHKIKYQDGELQFKVKLPETWKETNLDLKIKSGNGKLEKSSSGANVYKLSNVTQDTVLTVGNENSQNVTVNLTPKNEDIEFTDIYDENIILPKENTIKLGQDLSFKVVSKSGKSVDELKIISASNNPITELDGISNAYTLTALSSDTVSTEQTINNPQNQNDTAAEPSAPNVFGSMLRGVTRTLLGSQSTNRNGGDTHPDDEDYKEHNNVDLNGVDAFRKVVGMTLADLYTFVRPGLQYSSNDVLPQFDFTGTESDAKYIVFSEDERAKTCVNKKPIKFGDDNTAVFQIDENRTVDEGDNPVLTLPPVCYRYKDPNVNAWYGDAYSPGDSYKDPAHPEYTYPSGKFSLVLRKEMSNDSKVSLKFDEYKISGTRTTYGDGNAYKYDRSFTVSKDKSNYGDGNPNHVIVTVPKLSKSEGSLHFDEYEYLYPFINSNPYNYETPYSYHRAGKLYSPVTFSTLLVRDPDYREDHDPDDPPRELTPYDDPETTLLYRLGKCYCHILDEVYNEVSINKSELGDVSI